MLGVRTLIGVVTGTKRDKYEDQIAWIRPLAASTNDLWEATVSPESDFPTRGFIFWPHAIGVKENALIRFHAKENSVKSDGPDEYIVADSQPIFEVIDLRAVGDCEQVRLALTHGIDIPHISSPKYLIRCTDNLVVGPITLVVDCAGKATLEKNNRARIPCYQLLEDAFFGITFEDEKRTILAGALPQLAHSYVDWDDDRLVMRRAIEAAAKLKGNSANLPRHLIEDASAQLTQYGADASARLEIYRLKRAKILAADTQQVVSLAEEIFSGLRDHPSVIQEVQKFVQAQRDEVRSTIEREQAAEQKTLAKLRQQREETEEALRSTRRQLEETEARLKDQVSGIETALASRIDQVLENVPALLADVALFKPFLQNRPLQNRDTSSSGTGMSAAAEAAALSLEWPSATLKITETKELKVRIIRALRALGVQTTAYQPIHAAFATGLMPIVSGARALEALEAYAHVMCAGPHVLPGASSAQLPELLDRDFDWDTLTGSQMSFAYQEGVKLIVTNKGKNGTGFCVCESCGAAWLSDDPDSAEKHPRPFLLPDYVLKREQPPKMCSGNVRKGLYLGHQFRTDILLLRLEFKATMDFSPDRPWLNDALATCAEAVALGSSLGLSIDPGELSSGYRFVPPSHGGIGAAEIYLFDTASGGAGYAYEVGRNLPEMLQHIEALLKTCPVHCERSCTKCLRHYGNRFLHPRLDRRLGLQLLRYARFSEQPSIPSSGEQRNTLEPLARFLNLEGWSVDWADSALVATSEHGSRPVAIGTYPALLAKAEAEKRHALSHHSSRIPILLPDYLVERDLPSAYQEVMKHVKV